VYVEYISLDLVFGPVYLYLNTVLQLIQDGNFFCVCEDDNDSSASVKG